MLKSIISKIASNEELENNKVIDFINGLESEKFGISENSTYLEKKYSKILEMYKDEDEENQH
jgi:hypothetical protein